MQVWSDYLKAIYHPSSLIEFHDYSIDNPSNPFDLFVQGKEFFSHEEQVGPEFFP